jgi:hypothetical protein
MGFKYFMKKILFPLFASLLLWFNVGCNDQVSEEKELLPTARIEPYRFSDTLINLDAKMLLQNFYRPVRFNGEIALWEPRAEDLVGYKVSDDSMMHTCLDTIIAVPSKNLLLLALFRTDSYYKGEVQSCHVCAPDLGIATLEKIGGGYKVLNFKRDFTANGSTGERGDINLEKFGEDYFLLKFSSGWVGTGAVLEFASYFDINTYEKKIDFWPYNSNDGMCDSMQLPCDRIEKKLIHKPNGAYDNFQIIVRHSYIDNLKHETKITEETEYYKYDEDEMQYHQVGRKNAVK